MNREDPQHRIDPLVAAALAELRTEPAAQPDWERMHRSILDRAGPILARRRFRRVAAVARPLIPLALAASIAFALWLGPEMLIDRPDPATSTASAVDLEDEAVLVEALLGDLSDQEFRMMVTGRANPEALLAVAVSDP